MSKTDAAPTYGWVFLSQFHRTMSKAFIALIIILLVVAYMAYQELKDDCSKLWQKGVDVFGYHIEIGAQNRTEMCAENQVEPTN